RRLADHLVLALARLAHEAQETQLQAGQQAEALVVLAARELQPRRLARLGREAVAREVALAVLLADLAADGANEGLDRLRVRREVAREWIGGGEQLARGAELALQA